MKKEPKLTFKIDGNQGTVYRETPKNKKQCYTEVVTLCFGRPGKDPVTTNVNVDLCDY